MGLCGFINPKPAMVPYRSEPRTTWREGSRERWLYDSQMWHHMVTYCVFSHTQVVSKCFLPHQVPPGVHRTTVTTCDSELLKFRSNDLTIEDVVVSFLHLVVVS